MIIFEIYVGWLHYYPEMKIQNGPPYLNIDKPDSEGSSLGRGQAELARRARCWRGPHQRQRQRSPRAAVAAQLQFLRTTA